MKWLRLPVIRWILALFVLALILLLADALCYSITLPVEIDVQHDFSVLHVGNTSLILGMIGTPTTLQIPPHDPVVHEYQIDGSDSTNNFTLDTSYLHSIASTPYYRFQAWMRDLDGTSHWRDLQVRTNNTLQTLLSWPDDINGASIGLPATSSLQIHIQLQRPETPMILNLLTSDGSTYHITLDRNDRYIKVTRDNPKSGNDIAIAQAFFPTDTAPFGAMVLDTLIRSALWAILVLLFVIVGESMIAVIQAGMGSLHAPVQSTSRVHSTSGDSMTGITGAMNRARTIQAQNLVVSLWRNLTSTLHPIALVALVLSLCFVSWIARVQYNAEPHIFDASAYLFAAKMYATGHFWVPLPPAIDRFPGAFMVQYNGRWFGQYAPGTALALVPGIWAGAPWLVEPLLGTFALLGIGFIAARLYNRSVATLTILLGVLSPFYSYLSASYLSHTVALFFFVWGLFLLIRFAQGEGVWNLPLSAAMFGMLGLTRDLVAVLLVAVVVPGVMALSWRRISKEWSRWLPGGTLFIVVALLFVGMSLDFNAIITGNLWITPRALFFSGDRWGFGQGIGFYGQHTLAAGFVNMDELLTILAIDLYGWPFYLAFALMLMPFLTLRAKAADWFALFSAVIIAGAYIGYFYHGIYLGPRYLFEAMPFLLILTARGILTLSATGVTVSAAIRNRLTHSRQAVQTASVSPQLATPASLPPHSSYSVVTALFVLVLISCNLFYYMPRQIELHQNYSGYPAGYTIDLNALYHPPLHNAIVVTGDGFAYQMILFPLNDPYLHDDVIYALASSSADYQELHAAFPGRTLYRLIINVDGSVQYVQLQLQKKL